ncbi:adenylate/guanylate cyclase domain-containing protein [Pantoea sp.]|uniref:nucleotide-binding domain-containing protein n=1 Tax=Pantoea sp. TaxID=69393 RepID=UPI0031D701D3
MSIEDIYKGLGRSLDATLSKRNSTNLIKSDSAYDSSESLMESKWGRSKISSESLASAPESYGVKNLVRNKFGKHGLMQQSFGCHPDFDEIDGKSELRYGYAITLFMDIIGSTKLGVTYTPLEVFEIKNDIIRCAIETIDSFDGHVHRIMGDAVMAFFRSDRKQNDGLIMDHAIDALNCSVFLIEMMEKVVSPKLSSMGADKIGIRIGIDYGKDEEVIWGTYGYYGSHEVTATSYHVDVAAKLQQKAPKNSILVGENFVELLGFDEKLISVMEKIKAGVPEKQEFVKPNYLTSNGRPKNYRQYLINHDFYKKLTPIDSYPESLEITATLKKSEDLPSDDYYERCSRSIKKGSGISFKVKYKSIPDRKLRFLFRVENTGAEAKQKENSANHQKYVDAVYQGDGIYFARHWEGTEYKGIHHMFVSVWSDETRLIDEERFSIFITDSLES